MNERSAPGETRVTPPSRFLVTMWGVTTRVLTCLFAFLLTSCTLPGVSSQAVSRVSPPLKPVGTYSLKGDPNFDPNQLPGEMKLWHTRLWYGVRYVNDHDSDFDPETLAASGDLNALGRKFSNYVTTLLTALRVTKDLALLDEVDRLMEIARTQLADYNADGFRNWRYLAESGDRTYYNDDYHVMEEILTHSVVAAAAAALHENAAFSERYREHAIFWEDYLKNDFEAKWRERNDVRSGFPFLTRDLMHPYVEFIRYHLYMYELTSETGYLSEAERMAAEVTQQVKRVYTTGGPAYVWDQRFLPAADGAGSLACQPFVYLRLTFQAFQDLAMEGMSVFDDTFMQYVATSMTSLVMRDSYRSFTKDICGGTYQAGIKPSSGDGGITFHFVNYPYAVVGKWDATGRLERAVRRAYAEVDLDDNFYPVGRANLAAEMLFLLANNPDGQRTEK